MKVHVDSDSCVGHGQCAANGPTVYILDELGYALSPAGHIPDELQEQARTGAAACPERAISFSP
jgi:ferredoxin